MLVGSLDLVSSDDFHIIWFSFVYSYCVTSYSGGVALPPFRNQHGRLSLECYGKWDKSNNECSSHHQLTSKTSYDSGFPFCDLQHT